MPHAIAVATRVSRPWRIAAEGAGLGLLLVFSFWYAYYAADHFRPRPDYYGYSPAVGVATGRGFVDPVPAPGSPLSNFLTGQTASVAMAEATAPRWQEPAQYLRANQYLVYAIGYTWRWTGISWNGLLVVAAALHALGVLGAYALARLSLPASFAFVGAFWMATSTLSLRLLPHLRDYSKGAFIVAVLPLVVVLALGARSRRVLMLIALATGLLTGVGIGFKMDVAVMLPLAVVSILVFRGERPWHGLGEKALAVLTLTLSATTAAGPVLMSASQGGSNAAHVILLGWAQVFDTSLGVVRSVYSVLPFYDDGYVASVIQAFHDPQAAVGLRFTSREYDAAGMDMWFQIARTFPADVIVRVIAAANATLNLVYTNPDFAFLDPPPPLAGGLSAVYAWLARWNGTGWILGAGFIAAASGASLRTGLLVTWLLLSVGGYAFLQFADRHYFHTQIIPVMAILSLAFAAYRLLRPTAGVRWLVAGAPRRVVVGLLVAAFAMAVPVTALRAYQSRAVRRVIVEFERSAMVQLPFEITPSGPASAVVTWPTRVMSQAPAQVSDYYVIEFAAGTAGAPLAVRLSFDSAPPQNNPSRVLALTTDDGVSRFGFAALATPGLTTFLGLELDADTARRMTAVYRAHSRGPAGLPLDLELPSRWPERPLYQRLALEGGPSSRGPRVLCAGNGSCRGLLGYVGALPQHQILAAGAVGAIHAPIATLTSRGVVVDGTVDNGSSYLFELPETVVPASGALVVQGRLDQGGVAIGLLKDTRWYKQVILTEPGSFIVVVPADEAGVYRPLITNAMPPGAQRNHVTIEKATFVLREQLTK